jgi:hypothetical protein
MNGTNCKKEREEGSQQGRGRMNGVEEGSKLQRGKVKRCCCSDRQGFGLCEDRGCGSIQKQRE